MPVSKILCNKRQGKGTLFRNIQNTGRWNYSADRFLEINDGDPDPL